MWKLPDIHLPKSPNYLFFLISWWKCLLDSECNSVTLPQGSIVPFLPQTAIKQKRRQTWDLLSPPPPWRWTVGTYYPLCMQFPHGNSCKSHKHRQQNTFQTRNLCPISSQSSKTLANHFMFILVPAMTPWGKLKNTFSLRTGFDKEF